jgi:hypothetical protein
MANTSPAGACPICGGALDLDRPDLPVLDATCASCGWHTSSDSARQRQRSAQGDAEVLMATPIRRFLALPS